MSLVESLLQSQPQKFGLWPSVWKLLRLRVRIFWNGFTRAKLRQKIGTIVIAVLLVGGMALLFFLSSLLLRFMQSPALSQYVDPTQFLDAIPTLVLTGAFLLTIMTNFGVLLQSLYLSHDMDFLVTSPLPMRAVFLAKLLEAILPNFALFCAFSLPVLFGLGIASHYTILYYPLLLAMLILLALAAGGLASILVMAVVRVVPARRVAEVVGFVGAMVSILCGQSGNIMNAMHVKGSDLGAALGTFTSVNTPFSPLAWAGRGLLAIGQANWLPGAGLTAISLVLAGGLFAGTLYLAEQLYYTGWASMQGSVQRKRAPRPVIAAGSTVPVVSTHAAPNAAARLIPAPVRGLVVKDLLLLRRDPRNLSQLITPLILGFVMLFSTRGGGRNTGAALEQIGVAHIEQYIVIILAIFVGWVLMLNLGSLAFTREGRSYWMLKAAPLRPWQMLAGKFAVSYLPAVSLSLAFLVLSFFIRGVTLTFLPFGVLVVALSIAGATAIALAFGAVGANLDWDSPNRQRLRGTGGCVMFIVVSLFLLLDLVLFFLPPALWQILTALHGGLVQPPFLAYVLGILLGGAGALTGVFVPLRLVAPRLARIGEE
jgi:ABC-2 type transport system permease protein